MKPIGTIAAEPSDERGPKALNFLREKYPNEDWRLIPEIGRGFPCVKSFSTGVHAFDRPRLIERKADVSNFLNGRVLEACSSC